MRKIRKCYVIVKSQKELDSLSYNDKRTIIIAFGNRACPARVTTAFASSIFVSDEYHVTVFSGNRVYAEDHAHVQVSRDSYVILKDYAGCEVYGASYVMGVGNSKIYLLTDKAKIERLEHNRMYRRRPIFD